VAGEGEKPSSPEGARPFEREDALQRIEQAESLLELGFAEAALLAAWSASEATVRVLIEQEGISADLFNPIHVLSRATTDGVISRDDYRLLTEAKKYRNALVHGFKFDDFDYNLLGDLIRTTRRLFTLND